MTTDIPSDAIVAVIDAHMRFGEVRALAGASLVVRPGECIGLVGHNGAGKSTIVNIINGGLTPTSGSVGAGGSAASAWGIGPAREAGVRCVFQELSLCPNLTVAENARVLLPGLSGPGWKSRARSLVAEALSAVFPGHAIAPGARVASLSLTERQMAEAAMAFASAGRPPRLVILDEPTSSLDAERARQLLDHVARFTAQGGAVIFISHILGEILSAASRVVVMKDGRIVAERDRGGFTHQSLVAAMGGSAEAAAPRPPARPGAELARLAPPRGLPFHVAAGEIVGLAGLAGHGQTALLTALYEGAMPNWRPARDPAMAFVAGDRRFNGTFDLWSILRNITLAALPDDARLGLVRPDREEARAAAWKSRIDIRTPDLANPILSLSGGNQQKALFARALATRAPLVLMDDPMRGVDVATKHEVYRIIRDEAAQGRAFVWYSTEMDEMQLCDRVYVFREREIVAELGGADISEEAIIAASFRGAA